ncbi:MAG: HAD family hydrolase [Candidatus Thorarchaeota archaeon]|nr:HAD family hydrolase [Candidatus Thorarchaeota archaeon]
MSGFNPNQFDAIIFDLDSTLTDTHQYPIVACEWLLKRTGIDSEDVIASYVRHLVIRYRKAIQAIADGASYRSAFEIVYTSMKESLIDINHNVDATVVKEAAEHFKTLHIELSTGHDGVYEFLKTLQSRNIKLGVLSNSFAGNARIILNKLELSSFFSSIVDCGDVSAFKPMREPFDRVLQELNTDASRALYVGDEYYADMVGAKLLGITTVWINNRAISIEDQVAKYGISTTPDFVLKTITEFGELL